MRRKDENEIVLRGIPISRGIGIGSPVFFLTSEEEIQEISIRDREVESEIARYRKALHSSRRDVEELHQLSLLEGSHEAVSILQSHLEILQDPLLTSAIEEKIRVMQKASESVFLHVIREFKDRFNRLDDSYFKERVKDVDDISRRILGHLIPTEKTKISHLPTNSIVLTHELVPSDTVEANASLVRAFVTAAGGITSHAAIIARAKGIPYVANVDIKHLKGVSVNALIVDGSQGLVILNPSRSTLKKYQEMQQSYHSSHKKLQNTSKLKGETIDGYEVRVFANLENPSEIHQITEADAEGIGLFRSEYLFLLGKAFPSEEEQFSIYKKMVKALKGKPLVVRIFDIGGDKKVDLSPNHPDSHYFASIGHEVNPALGCRAIRFLLKNPDLLHTQLRAILRASAFGQIHILVPMVSDLSELQMVREKIAEVKKQLAKERKKTSNHIPVGCMIEVPSSALMCDVFARHADFLSIGTNDLLQYVLAADRSNPNTWDMSFSSHPSILRLIRNVVTAAAAESKPLILCGESAADPSMIPLLIGLGIREFSVSARHIPLVKHTIRKWRILEACQLAERAIECKSSCELREFLAKESVR